MRDYTDAQRAEIRRYTELGYQIAIILHDGSVCPGYLSWALPWLLDDWEEPFQVEYDEHGQAHRV